MTSDEREAKLPAWARSALAQARTEAKAAERLADVAQRAAALARRAFPAADCPVSYDGPDGETYGLPGVDTVNFGDVSITVSGNGLTVETPQCLVVLPVGANMVRIRSVRDGR